MKECSTEIMHQISHHAYNCMIFLPNLFVHGVPALTLTHRYGEELTRESALRDATEGKEIELNRENASLRYVSDTCLYIYVNIQLHTLGH